MVQMDEQRKKKKNEALTDGDENEEMMKPYLEIKKGHRLLWILPRWHAGTWSWKRDRLRSSKTVLRRSFYSVNTGDGDPSKSPRAD